MICRLAFLLLLALPFVTKGQADLRNTSLTEPGRNLLYRGVSNVIEVTGITYTSAMRLISSRNMLPEHMSRYEDKFYLMEHASDGADTLSLYQGNQLLVRKVFNTATIPDPVLQLGIVKDSFARVPDILAYPSLRVVFPGCYYKTRIRIISFDIRVIPARGTSTDLGTTTGPDLSAQQQSYIRSLQPGSTIILENTKFIAAGGCPRSLSPITIRVR